MAPRVPTNSNLTGRVPRLGDVVAASETPQRPKVARGVFAYLSPSVVEYMRAEIQAAEGREVFFVANTDNSGMAHTAKAYARGNRAATPAIVNRCMPHDVVIHNHPSGALHPSDADIGVASLLGESSVGFYIVDNDVKNIYVVVEPFARPDKTAPVLEPKDLDALAPGGAIEDTLPGYEHRPAQLEMAQEVLEAFRSDKILMVEAGTGTGKSLAYLVPAILWSVRTGERVIVSTNTINLQEQLIRKDIPLLAKSLGVEFEAELVKGRGNYACKRKVDSVTIEGTLYTDDAEVQLTKELLAWARTSSDGSRSDLAFVPREDIWEKIESQSDTCLGVRCHHYHDCFFNTARRRAAKAQILVVNHHLLCADLAVRRETGNMSSISLLPPAARLIVDEAHHMEEVAASYFGITVTRAGLMRVLSQLHRQRRSDTGVLSVAISKLTSGSPDALRLADLIQQRAIPGKEVIRQEGEQLMLELFELVRRMGAREGEEDAASRKLRITRMVREEDGFASLVSSVTLLSQQIRDYARALDMLGEQLVDFGGGRAGSVSDQGVLIRAYAGRLSGFADGLETAFKQDGPGWVTWLEGRALKGGGFTLRLSSCPVRVGESLDEALFKRFKTVVFTSATLAVEKDFGYFEERIGLDRVAEERRVHRQYPSPFNYQSNAILAMPEDLPQPDDPKFQQAAADTILDAVLASHGRAFVLTTSFYMLRYLHARLAPVLSRLGIRCLRQGDAPRTQLMEQFCRDKSSVLFGTDSFWEGVDAKGEALELVVITRLPFRVPTEPLVEARIEEITARAGNAFGEYSLPQAILKLKQGFGRLIRGQFDRGVVLVLDRRILDRPYGRRFRASLPPASQLKGPWKVLKEELSHFFGRDPLVNDAR